MQPEIEDQPIQALCELRVTGKNNFDTSLKGPRLRSIFFNYRKFTEPESHIHSCVGEVTTSHWGISENRLYFWGLIFTGCVI